MNTRNRAQLRRWYIIYEDTQGNTSNLITLLPPTAEAMAKAKATREAARLGMAACTLKAASTLGGKR